MKKAAKKTTAKATTQDRVEYYKDPGGEWRWRVYAAENGKIIGMSSEGYVDYEDAVANVKRLGTMSTREFTAVVLEA